MKETMSTVRFLLSGYLVLTCLQGLLFAQTSTFTPPGLSVRFLGFTNNVRGDAAVFYFTNSAPHKLGFQVTALEYLRDGVWTPAPPTQGASLQRAPDGSYRVQGSGKSFAAGGGFSHSLTASSAFTRQFDVHETNAVWRIQLFCVEDAAGLPAVVERGREVIKKVQTGKKVEILSGRKYVVTGQTAPTNGNTNGPAKGSQPLRQETNHKSPSAGFGE